MLDVASEFGIEQTVTMCPVDDIVPLRECFGDRIAFNAMIMKRTADESDDLAYRTLDRFLELGVKIVKLWSSEEAVKRGPVRRCSLAHRGR